MNEQRPDSDILLTQDQEKEARARPGRLKVFLGYVAGVGKTYTMLETAWYRKLDGADLIAAYVETHGRFETDSLLSGLEITPKKEIEYQGEKLPEMDLDAVLARKPQIALVDDLSHTNAPGCRHRKRWQDVFELLDAGIDVYTTLNVQHLESLNDVVRQITAMVVRETLPDSVLDRADEIELVDLPPEDLLQRLQEGKVHVAAFEATQENFFRKGNLIALRELALRRTAERVDAQMQSYRCTERVREIWPAAERILVCIGANPRSIRLIRAAKRMATGLRADWLAVHVEAPAKVRPKESDLRQLANHMHLAESLGAETVILSGHDASEEILSYARVRNVTKIIIGKPTHPRWKDRLFGSVLDDVVRGSGGIDVYVITGESGEAPQLPAKRASAPWQPREWLWSVAGVGASTLVALLLHPYFGLVDLVMVYLLGVVITASRAGKGPSLLATLLSVAAFNFFFVPPRFTFNVHDPRHFFTFGVMFIVAYVICRLTLRVRDQAEAARRRERRIATLYSLSRELAHHRGVQTLSKLAVKHISELFSSQVAILVPDETGQLSVPVTGPGTFALEDQELRVAKWVFDHRQRAGRGTDTLPGAQGLYLPLTAASQTMGVIGVLPGAETGPFDHEQVQTLESFASQTAMAIERAFFAEETQRAQLKAETEALRSTLLSSVSHDLRTPLAAITGAATTLLQDIGDLDDAGRRELTQTVCEEAEHLSRLIRNILDMTRLESGAIKITKEWQSMEEIVGVVLNRLGDRLKDRPVEIDLPVDLPLFPFDPLLIEQLLTNLLENALKYTPEGTPLELSAAVKEKNVEVVVADRGPGLAPGEEERIFEKFVHGPSGRGVGLGLAICRAIVAAHGGRIRAGNRPGGGAAFHFTLPLGGLPPLPAPEEES